MTFFTTWFVVFSVGLIAVISPGPDFVLTMRNSLVYSRRAGIYTAVGIVVGHIVHVTYCLIGVGAIIARSILLFNVLKWMGAAYLIYVGIKCLQARKHRSEISDLQQDEDISPWRAFRIGFLGDLLNPKTTLFFLALFTQLIHPGTSLLVQAAYGATVVGIAFVWYPLVAILISQRIIRKAFESISHWLERATGVVLIALGLRLALSRAHD
jgi:RhtB (resistance to homoserine/threonine) family protein